jgi:flagellar biosynthesis/type III secretory pathway chaperone
LKTEPPPAGLIPRLIETLRDELHQYGEMLALLDQQQEHVMARAADEVMRSVSSINQHMEVIQRARQARETCQKEVAQVLQRPEESTFVNLVPLLPEKFQGAVVSLVRENNTLLERVHRRARQNQLLLSRSLELMQRFLNSLTQVAPPTTYNGNGQIHGAAEPAQTLYQAVG